MTHSKYGKKRLNDRLDCTHRPARNDSKAGNTEIKCRQKKTHRQLRQDSRILVGRE
jgi:hypothetical protein